jgi:dephospho-CoA kinase
MIAGLTGGIGSGKSTVARLFEIMGCEVFNSDQVAREVYFEDDVRLRVTGLLGRDAYKDEQLNKPYISSRIFSDTLLLHQLNAIIHPAVIRRFNEFAKEHQGKIIIKESALLFEANLTGGLDKIIVVVADDELRINRVMKRENISRDEVMKRIKSQLPQTEKAKKADFIIENNEREFLITQTLAIFKELEKLSHA